MHPNAIDADVIGAFLTGTTCESLVHKLGRKCPCTTKELLDIVTSHACGEEAVGAIFDRSRGKDKRDEAASEGTLNQPGKKKKGKEGGRGNLVAVANRKADKGPAGETSDHFEKLLEKPCTNHAYPIKHLFKDCGFMKKWLVGFSQKGEHKKKKAEPADSDAEEKDDAFPTPTGAC